MLLKSTLSLLAAASLASSTAVARDGYGRCVNDNCLKAVKKAGNYGWWDCYFARRVTTTPPAYTTTTTVTSTVNTTTSTVEPYATDTTTTLSYTDTFTETSTETPTTTYSTTSTIQPYPGSGRDVRRMAEPQPTADVHVARAAAPLGHFPLAVALAAETASPAKRAAARLGHFPLEALPAEEQEEAAAIAGLTKRSYSVCPSKDKYLSACSCNGVPKATVTAVRKTVRSTATAYVTSTYTSTSTSTTINTYSESTTSSTTTQTTTTTTSTTTYSTSTLASPTCTSFRKGPSAQFQYQYNLEYAGFKTLNPGSQANDPSAPAMTQIQPGTQSTCEAADQCVNWAATTFAPNGMGAYFTVNLRFRPDTTDWLCVAYFDQAPRSDYNQDSPGVSQSFGWTKRP